MGWRKLPGSQPTSKARRRHGVERGMGTRSPEALDFWWILPRSWENSSEAVVLLLQYMGLESRCKAPGDAALPLKGTRHCLGGASLRHLSNGHTAIFY